LDQCMLLLCTLPAAAFLALRRPVIAPPWL
jgi:hypothetical protein